MAFQGTFDLLKKTSKMTHWLKVLVQIYRYEAAKAQILTAATGMTGACFAIWIDAVDANQASSLWILPFSAGGFLNIALVSVLPELLQDKNPKESLIQLCFLFLGVSTMALICLVWVRHFQELLIKYWLNWISWI